MRDAPAVSYSEAKKRAAIGIALGVIFSFLLVIVPPFVGRSLCRKDAFASGLTGGVTTYAYIVLGVLVGSLLAAEMVGIVTHWRSRKFDVSPYVRHMDLRRSIYRRIVSAAIDNATPLRCVLVLCLIAYALLIPFMTVDIYCLAPHYISAKFSPIERVRRYDWSQVRTVKSTCWFRREKYGGSHWNAAVVLVMDDGAQIEGPSSSTHRLDPFYGNLASALRGRRVVFDRSAVPARCDAPDLAALVRKAN